MEAATLALRSAQAPQAEEPELISATAKRTHEAISSTPIMAPVAKRVRTTAEEPDLVVVDIYDYALFYQAMQIAASISESIQFFISELAGHHCLEYYGVGAANSVCYQGKWLVTGQKVPECSEQKLGPYYVKGALFLSALQNKASRGDDSFLRIRLSPSKNSVVLKYTGNPLKPDRLSIREVVHLVDEDPELNIEVGVLKYLHKVKFAVEDLRNVFKALHDNKYVSFTFTLYTDEDTGAYAIRIDARTVLRRSRFTFYHQPAVGEPGGEAVPTGDKTDFDAMNLIFRRVFHVQRFYQFLRYMKEHYLTICFHNDYPICLRYQLASTHPEASSYIECFICSISDDDGDAPAVPAPDAPRPTEASETESSSTPW